MIKKYFYFLVVVLCVSGCAGNPKQKDNSSVLPLESAIGNDAEGSIEHENQQNIVASATLDTSVENSESNFPDGGGTTAKYAKSKDKIVNRLLYLARVAFDKKRFLTPAHDNANLYYQAALGREPGNYDATLGLAEIVETYIEWAQNAASNHQYKVAYRYLNKAKSVNPQDPLISETFAQISGEERERKQKRASVVRSNDSSVSNRYYLPSNLFRLSETEILAKMQPIIDRVNLKQERLVINWANDKEARLIYQIINSRTSEFRVRAMIHHRTDYSIELKPN
ncbi:hypothetical protein [Marinomonas balearica]|uniref:Uncharacterized protein n=1 Tax=Marinomonas balearica TaxID=491947 RepID=A0A4R6MBQ1_9GAMM|nr:hypothetical protein [Marinomonas balearica]TDO98736.1 hypothetical protein DFP79_1148 [Marinomonas balearica]